MALFCALLLAIQNLGAWGMRGHTLTNLAAVEAIPANGPVFLKAQKAYIGHLGIIPDTWRSVTEPFPRISEDANHSWYILILSRSRPSRGLNSFSAFIMNTFGW